MPANRFNNFTDYGIGIGLRAPHYDHILTRKPVVDWSEIISENFMIDGGRPLRDAPRSGNTIERAIELAFKKSSVLVLDRATFVQHAFQTWATLGWFCRPDAKLRGEKGREKRA